MQITINGETQSIDAGTTIATLLEILGLAGKPVVIELNKQALFPRHYATTVLDNDDRIEIITIAAGG